MKSSIILLAYLSASVSAFFSNSESSLVYSCISSRQPCTLQDVVLESENELDRVTFTSINSPLTIESGKIPHFSRKLAEKLVGIVDLTINGLQLTTLYIKPEMIHLEAKNNQIENLLLEESSKTYEMLSLDLTGNRLSNVTMLSRFTNLRYLTLDQNNLETLSMDVFANMSELRKLSLARNQLYSVSTENKFQLLKLQYLSLARNELFELNIERWELDSLTELDLSYNKLYLLDKSLGQFKSLAHVKISENKWKCEFLKQMNQIEQLKFDRDESDRCETKVKQVCCTLDASDILVSTAELFDDKWEELSKLNETFEQFKAATEQNQLRMEESKEDLNSTLLQRIKQLEDEQQTLLAKLNDREASVAVQELKESCEFEYEKLNLSQSNLESKLEQLEKTLDEKSKAFDELKENMSKLENKTMDNNVDNVEKTIRELSDKFIHLERQQVKYFLSTVDLKNQIGAQRTKTTEGQEHYSKLQMDVTRLSDSLEYAWEKIDNILQVLNDLS